jgi:riboflavin synthase
MFTGIVEEIGIVKEIKGSSKGMRLTLASKLCSREVKIGDSLAVNGCCLTIVLIKGKGASRLLGFDILDLTWQSTNLKECVPGALVNLERPLAASGRFHGHIVSGHIDGAGKIKSFKPAGADWKLEIEINSKALPYLIHKGSIAVDGISLTIAELHRNSFTAWIIPHTREVTALRDRKEGDKVNLEFDLIGKYVERLLKIGSISSRRAAAN